MRFFQKIKKTRKRKHDERRTRKKISEHAQIFISDSGFCRNLARVSKANRRTCTQNGSKINTIFFFFSHPKVSQAQKISFFFRNNITKHKIFLFSCPAVEPDTKDFFFLLPQCRIIQKISFFDAKVIGKENLFLFSCFQNDTKKIYFFFL